MSENSEKESYPLVSELCLQHAAKLAIVDDKPIMLDYWTDSCEKNVIIGVKEDGDKLLVRSVDEYTSPITKIFKIKDELIVATENSIYIVRADIDKKYISEQE